MIAVGAAASLDYFVQKPSLDAFAEPGVRVQARKRLRNLADTFFARISPLHRQVFHAAAALRANGLRIERQQLKNVVRHIGAD